jgi:hypothetical protein
VTGPHDWIEAEEKADVADVPFPPRESARLVTGPLAQQIAKVREWLPESAEVLPMDERNPFAALAAIERHVQDMESAIEEWAFDQGYDSLSSESIVVDIRNRAAALPAREKGTE